MNQGVGNDLYYVEHYANRTWAFYTYILAFIIQRSQPGPILDVGCGGGYFVECAHRWGLPCRGLDGSAAAIRRARERNSELDVQQHLLSEKFPFPDGSFQTVVMNQVIEHLEAPVAIHALQECYRVLKPEGMIYVDSPSKFNRAERVNDPTHINMLRPAELVRLLRDCGFERVASRNTALRPFGCSALLNLPMRALFRLTRWDRLSATANCSGFKPKGSETTLSGNAS